MYCIYTDILEKVINLIIYQKLILIIIRLPIMSTCKNINYLYTLNI